MIRFVTGDLIASAIHEHHFDCIAHGVNCQGVMGSGIARTIRDRMPIVYRRYREAHANGQLELGFVQNVPVRSLEGRGGFGLTVWNCATQEYYGRSGKAYADLDAVKMCMQQVLELSLQMQIVPRGVAGLRRLEPLHIGLPMIGAGLGGLKPDDILTVFQDVFEASKRVRATVFETYAPGTVCETWYN